MKPFPSEYQQRRRHYILRGVLLLWFCLLAFWMGPHLIVFHRLTALAPADFVPLVEQRCVPAVRAIKIYVRDHGRMPDDLEVLGPPFTSNMGFGNFYRQTSRATTQPEFSYFAYDMHNHTIEYDFTPGHEGWSVFGPFVKGAIPVPPVTIDPAPATGP